MRSFLLTASILCIIVGALGGALAAVFIHTSISSGVLLGGVYGFIFGLLVAPRAVSPGAGLVWGLGYAFILWLAIPAGILPVTMGGMPEMGMLDAARAHFPELTAYVLCFGMPLGVALGIWGGVHPQPGQAGFSFPRALVVGGLAGVLGGWAFGRWMEQVNLYPLIAGLVRSDSRMIGATLHFSFAVIIGASYGVLFQRDVRGYGSNPTWVGGWPTGCSGGSWGL